MVAFRLWSVRPRSPCEQQYTKTKEKHKTSGSAEPFSNPFLSTRKSDDKGNGDGDDGQRILLSPLFLEGKEGRVGFRAKRERERKRGWRPRIECKWKGGIGSLLGLLSGQDAV